MRALRRKPLAMVFVCAWLAAAGLGLHGLWGYANRPGEVGAAPVDWPVGTKLTRATDRATLVMFVHPKCPCSRASASELARLMARTTGPLDVKVLAVEPPDAPAQWSESALLQTLRNLPGATVSDDQGGAEARHFGAKTSGHAMLFDRTGRLLFSGGITSARGHEGDNAGIDSIVALVNHTGESRAAADVFGCSLLGESSGQRAQ